MQVLLGFDQQLMLSLLKKEASYGAAVTVNSSNFLGIRHHADFNPDFGDNVQNDKDLVTGLEYGSDQFIIGRSFKFPFSMPNVTPAALAGLIALSEGVITSTKNGANDEYTHDISEIAAGSALPSINVIAKKGGTQYLLVGGKGGGYELKFEEDKCISFSTSLVGSGARTINAASFIAPAVESWMLANPTTLKWTSGADIAIAATFAQGVQGISASTPTNLSSNIKSLTFKRTIPLIEEKMGGAGYNSDIAYSRRGAELSAVLRYADYITLYENQTVMALEIENIQVERGFIDSTGGTLYYGIKLVIPRAKVKKMPFPLGGSKDELTMNVDFDIQNDGTHKAFYIQTYNAIPAFLAA